MLEGANILVVDIETLHSADDCLHCHQPESWHHEVPQTLGLPLTGEKPLPCAGFATIGWENKGALGISVACTFDYQDSQLHWFDATMLEQVVRTWVARQPLLVSFNGTVFDFALMRALLRFGGRPGLHPLCDRFKRLCATGYDLLQAIWQVQPEQKYAKGLNSLDAICAANGLPRKEMDGATAPRLWRERRYAEVIQYNVNDVLRTKALFEMVINGQPIQRSDGSALKLPVPQQIQRSVTDQQHVWADEDATDGSTTAP